MIFLLLTRYKASKFLTRYYCRVIFRESTTCGQTRSWEVWFLGSGRWQTTAGPVVRALPDRRPRLEQVPSVLISKISGEEIANTKTRALPANRAEKTW